MEDSQNASMTRPKAATAVGIINIIFTGLGILGGFISLGMFSMMKALTLRLGQEFAQEFGAMMPVIGTFFTLITVITLVQFVINALGLAGGIGLLKQKFWSINLANVYAAATIVLAIANFFVVRQIIVGVLENPMLLSAVPPEERFALDIVKTVVPGFAGVFGIFFASAYPVLVLILLNRPKVKDFYAARREE